MSNRATRSVLLTICLALFPLATVIAQDSVYLEPMTDESIQWNLYHVNQQLGSTHICGNFSYGFTFVEPPSNTLYIEFRINNLNTSRPNAEDSWVVIHNATSEPFQWNFSTLDFSVGIHTIRVIEYNPPNQSGGFLIGGGTFFFEHEDRSGEQVLYNGASMIVVASIIASIVGLGFAFYKRVKWEWDLPEPPTSRFERGVAMLL